MPRFNNIPDCNLCTHKQDPQGRWCYMFFNKPDFHCMKYLPAHNITDNSKEVIEGLKELGEMGLEIPDHKSESMRHKIWGDECQNNRADNIEFMARAFIEATGIDPVYAVLVEQHKDGITRWWFEKRERDTDNDIQGSKENESGL